MERGAHIILGEKRIEIQCEYCQNTWQHNRQLNAQERDQWPGTQVACSLFQLLIDLIERCLSDDLKGNMYSIKLNRFIDELIIHNTKADSYIMCSFVFSELKKAFDDTCICARLPDNSIKIVAFSHFDLNLNIFTEKILFYLKH